jgi:hypothetical protein
MAAAERGKRQKCSKMAGRQDRGSGRDRAMEVARQQHSNGGRAAAGVAITAAFQGQQVAGHDVSRLERYSVNVLLARLTKVRC